MKRRPDHLLALFALGNEMHHMGMRSESLVEFTETYGRREHRTDIVTTGGTITIFAWRTDA